MNRHSRPSSRISYASSTTSKISTIWGPGTLTGKALEAVGEATLRGVENLVIRRKLASLRTVFPHNNDTTVTNIEQVYDDVLELSRPHLYSKAVGQAALRLLMMQIDSRCTDHLIKGLGRWPEVEIRLLLSQVMSTCILDVERDGDLTSSDIRKWLSNSSQEALQLLPVIDFIAELARHNQSTRHATLEGGFLDMLLRIYVAFPTFYKLTAEAQEHRSALFIACQSALAVLLADAFHAEIVRNHPVYDLWLRGDHLASCYVPGTSEESLEDRCTAWRRTRPHLVKRRLMTIWSASAWSANDDAELQACIDVVEFSRQQYHDSEVVDLALLTIFKNIIVDCNAAQHLIVVLRRSPCQDTTRIVSGVVQLWLKYADTRELSYSTVELTGFLNVVSEWDRGRTGSIPDPLKNVNETIYNHEKDLLFSKILKKQRQLLPRNDPALSSIIHFLTLAAKQSMTFQWSLLDAGALAVVLIAFVDGVPILSDALHAFKHPLNDHRSKSRTFLESKRNTASSCISLSLIRTEASKLLDTIQNPAFQTLLQTQIFTKRRRICLSLLDILLGSGGGVDDVYTELRDIFEDILN